jgi:hypothetical protein
LRWSVSEMIDLNFDPGKRLLLSKIVHRVDQTGRLMKERFRQMPLLKRRRLAPDQPGDDDEVSSNCRNF